MTTDDQQKSEPEQPEQQQAKKRPRSERREQAARDVLRTFIRDLYVDRHGAALPRADEIDIRLQLKIRPGQAWDLSFEPSLVEQALIQMEDAEANWNVYQAGRVYCFRCEASDCEHSAPPSSLSVFHGYNEFGQPEWTEFAQALIMAKDDRVDRLFASSGGVVARVQYGHDLKLRQMSSFGKSSKTYSILGQVVAGYFALPSAEGKADRMALTFQIVEVRGEYGSIRLHLNVLGGGAGQSVSDLLASGWQPGVYRARESAAREVSRIEERVRSFRAHGKSDEARHALRQTPAVLRRLAESLERAARQGVRRTRHVEMRRKEQRPVHKALEDALAAPHNMIFRDEKGGTTVACGPQGRAHVFTDQGRHVTSFTIKPSSIEFRLRTHRWQNVNPGEADEFRKRISEFVPRKQSPQ